MRNFESALNDERKEILERDQHARKTTMYIGGKFRYIFLKKAQRRTKQEAKTFKQAMKNNNFFL